MQQGTMGIELGAGAAQGDGELQREIAASLGFVPPHFAPASASPATLAQLWGRMRASYLDNPLPGTVKEAVLATLGQYCAVPYPLVVHACALRAWGLDAAVVAALLDEPPSAGPALDPQLERLDLAPAPLSEWPELAAPLARAFLEACAGLYRGGADADRCARALRRWLVAEGFYHALALVDYARSAHLWAELHPEVDPLGDPRVREHRDALMASAPRLAVRFRAGRPPPPPPDWAAPAGLPSLDEARAGAATTELGEANERLRRAGLAAQHAADAAGAERDRLRQIFAQTPTILILTSGRDHTIEFANPAAHLAWPDRELIARPAGQALPELAVAGVVNLLDTAYTTGEASAGTEFPLRVTPLGTAEPTTAYFNVIIQRTTDAGGRTDGAMVHAIDVSESVRARQRIMELAASASMERDRLQHVIDALPEGILIVGATGEVLLHNRAAELVLGRGPAVPGLEVGTGATPAAVESTGRSSEPIARHFDGTLYEIDDLPLVRSVVRGEIVTGEQFLMRNVRTGRDIPVLASTAPLRNSAGVVIGAVASFRDITAIRDFDRARDEFLASVSHDLKTPLTSIRGLAQLGQRQLTRSESPDVARLRDRFAGIIAATRRMEGLVNELLDMARLDMGQPLEYDMRPTDLRRLVEHTVGDQRLVTDRHEIALVVEVDGPLTVSADPTRLARALANLASNAMKFSPTGGAVRIRLGRESAGGRPWAVLTIEDEGIGIPRADLPRIYDRFWRASNVVGRIDGTGLGLTSVRRIVEEHGGTVDVASTEGVGSVFTIRLPLNESHRQKGER